MEGDARGVGDVAEEDVLEGRVGSLEYLRQKRRAERLALAVDVGVVRTREIDPLERARTWCNVAIVANVASCNVANSQLALVVGIGNISTLATFHFPIRRDNQRLAGRELFHRLGRDVESGLYRGPLARHGDNVVADVVEAWTDAAGVARGEGPSVAGGAAQRPGAVRVGKGGGEGRGNGAGSDFGLRTFDFVALAKSDVRSLKSFLSQSLCDQFADEVAVGLACRKGTVARVVVEEFVGVSEVEVAGEEERMREFARLVDERMAERHVVFPERGVAEMAEEDVFVVRGS